MQQRLTELQKKVLVATLRIEEDAKQDVNTPIYDIMSSATPKEVASVLGLLDQPAAYAQRSPSHVEYVAKWVDTIIARVRHCMARLKRKGLLQYTYITPCRVMRGGFMLACKHRCYRLTDEGKKIARRMRFETERKAEFEAVKSEHLKSAVEELKGKSYATPDEILEAVWRREKDLFDEDRGLFSRYWNRTTLGREMKKMGYRLCQVRCNGKRIWTYELYSKEERIRDLKRALSLVRKRYWRATTEDIRKALWHICGSKLVSREVFEKVWNEKQIGEYMQKELKFKRFLKRSNESIKGEPDYIFWHYYDIRDVPPGEDVNGECL